jgi:hypothetical protein
VIGRLKLLFPTMLLCLALCHWSNQLCLVFLVFLCFTRLNISFLCEYDASWIPLQTFDFLILYFGVTRGLVSQSLLLALECFLEGFFQILFFHIAQETLTFSNLTNGFWKTQSIPTRLYVKGKFLFSHLDQDG